MKIVTINGSTYRMGDTMANNVLNIAKDAMAEKHSIYALIKGNVVIMKNDTFADLDSLKKETSAYIKDGFKVRYTMGGGNNRK